MSVQAGFIEARLKTHRRSTGGVAEKAASSGATTSSCPTSAAPCGCASAGSTCTNSASRSRTAAGSSCSPKWIAHFVSPGLVPPAEFPDREGRVDDAWAEPFDERFFYIDDLLVTTG